MPKDPSAKKPASAKKETKPIKKPKSSSKSIKDKVQKRVKSHAPKTPKIKTSATGVPEFDKVLSGGFPKGSVVLLSGGSGSGKTIFSFQWLFEGARKNEKGLYISFTEPLFKTVKNLEKLSFYNREVIEEGKVKVLDMRRIHDQEIFDPVDVIRTIEREVKENDISRVCMDSVTAIAYSLNDKAQIRKFIFDLGKILASLGVTTVLTSEVSNDRQYSVYGVEEFISDAIIKMNKHETPAGTLRFIKIAKVRGLHYEDDSIYFRITSDGILAFPAIKASLEYESTNRRVSSGIPSLDRMMHGGLMEGSTTLLSGAAGTGKTTACFHFINEGLKNNEPCLYLAFEESEDQLVRNAKGLGFDFEKYLKSGLLTLRSIYPSSKHVDEHLVDIKKLVEKHKVKRVALDAISTFFGDFERDVAAYFAKSVNAYLKSKGVTSYFTAATRRFVGTETLTDTELSSVSDNIITLRFSEIQGELKLIINIVKSRGSRHSKYLREFTIGDHGIRIGQTLKGYEGVLSGTTRKVSSSVEEQLQEEFKKFIGPMGDTVFFDLKEEGSLTVGNITEYIEEITKEGILKKEESSRFKTNVLRIMS